MPRTNKQILNALVEDAADIMESKRSHNELNLKHLRERHGSTDTVKAMAAHNRRITDAIELIREYAGTWA